jgi:hypothetical protein
MHSQVHDNGAKEAGWDYCEPPGNDVDYDSAIDCGPSRLDEKPS